MLICAVALTTKLINHPMTPNNTVEGQVKLLCTVMSGGRLEARHFRRTEYEPLYVHLASTDVIHMINVFPGLPRFSPLCRRCCYMHMELNLHIRIILWAKFL